MNHRSVSHLMCQLFKHPTSLNGKYFKYLRSELQLSRSSASFTVPEVKPFNDIPSLSVIPYVGSLHHYISLFGGTKIPAKIHELTDIWYHKYGPIFKEDLRALGTTGKYGIWLFDVNDIEKVHRSVGKYPVRGGFDPLEIYRKSRPDAYKALGLLILNGVDWQNFRSKVQPVLLQHKVISNYNSSISSIADEMIGEIRRLRDSSTMEIDDFLPELYRFTLESVAYVGLDTRFNCLSDYGPTQRDIVSSIKEMFDLEAKLNDSFTWRLIGKPFGAKWKRFFEINDHFTDMVFGFVKEKMKTISESPPKHPDEDFSAIELFLSRPDCTPEDAVTMVMDMFFAGIDTTAHLIAFTLYYLAKHPHIQDRVYQEINTASNGTGKLDYQQLSQLNLLRACIKEASRLKPVVPIQMRINTEPIVLSGFSIPSKCFLILNHYTMGRRPDYFDDPMTFNPDRWVRESRGEKKYHPFAVLTFGFGPRMCIGRRIAELEAFNLLSKIVHNFKTTTKNGELPTSTAIISYPDHPMNFRFEERH